MSMVFSSCTDEKPVVFFCENQNHSGIKDLGTANLLCVFGFGDHRHQRRLARAVKMKNLGFDRLT
jgi:hypothetical protein